VLGDGAAHASVQTEAGKVTAVTLTIAGAPSVVPGLLVPPPPPDPNDLRSSYWNSRRTAGAAIVGAGGLALILGGVFAAERASETSDASAAGAKVGAGNSGCSGAGSSSPSCGALANALHSNGSDARLEAIFLVSGAVLIVGGVVTTLWPSSAQSSTTALSPAVGPHGGGLAWTGSF
jgi:hypothetical protein